MKKFFKNLFGKKIYTYEDFYKSALQRQKILDAFVDHGICSLVHGCKTIKIFSKPLPPEDIKYIYERVVNLVQVFKNIKYNKMLRYR